MKHLTFQTLKQLQRLGITEITLTLDGYKRFYDAEIADLPTISTAHDSASTEAPNHVGTAFGVTVQCTDASAALAYAAAHRALSNQA